MTPSKAQRFIFSGYRIRSDRRSIVFTYRTVFAGGRTLRSSEQIVLPRAIPRSVSKAMLNKVLHGTHLALGVSYYKMFVPPKVQFRGQLSIQQANFWNNLYTKGLGEFIYQNKLSPKDMANFPFSKEEKPIPQRLPKKRRALVGIGGGKDSIVAAELLKDGSLPTDALLVETFGRIELPEAVIKKLGLRTLHIKRIPDPVLLKPPPGALNGHIPISAIYAWLGLLAALIYDYEYVVVANEHSSNIGNVRYRGINVNHQWSKSSTFESLFQDYVRNNITPSITYFSLLRPFYEIRIAEQFSRHKKYFSTFSSCNRAMRSKSTLPEKQRWCCKCPKCVFSFTILAPFVSKNSLLDIFGRNLFDDPALMPRFRDVLGFGQIKPFDCVGTFEETRAALYLAKNKYGSSLAVKTFLPRLGRQTKKQLGDVMRAQQAPNMPDYLRFLGIKNVALLGYAVEGQTTKAYLENHHPKLPITILDKKRDAKYLQKQDKFDLVVRTPGLPKRFVTAPSTTASNIFFSETSANIIGVTGTKGKSTTASLIHHILRSAGKSADLLGNVGTPMLSALSKKRTRNHWHVLELSSHQLDDIRYAPHIAVVTNLFDDHLDYYKSRAKYFAAKQNITLLQGTADYFVYNKEDIRLRAWAKQTRAATVPFGSARLLPDFQNPLLGKHNRANIQAAAIAAKIAGVRPSAISKAIATYKPLPHRLQRVGTFRGIDFFDDAISTTPESTIAALESVPKVQTIMLGGHDRGYSFGKLRKALKKHDVKNVVLFPDSGKRILGKNNSYVTKQTSSMREAVKFAYEKTQAGHVCLLSTASPSFGVWKDYKDKGGQFQRYVRQLGQ